MHVKYIVYYQGESTLPTVDIWKTAGELTHLIYAKQHGIIPKDISSEGYLNFNPIFKKWSLEHYQLDSVLPGRTLNDFIKKRNIEKRDRLLVRKKMNQTPFLLDPELQKAVWQENKKVKLASLRFLLGFQHD